MGKKYKIRLIISLLVAAVCAVLMPFVKVNPDMTKYLPDSSPMKAGLEILSDELGVDAMQATADVRLMFQGMSLSEADSIKRVFLADQAVNTVSYQRSQDGDYTLFELAVSKSTNQKKLARKLSESVAFPAVTQTSQDGNTPDPKALMLAVLALIVILFVMCRSWLEPVLMLAVTGLAVLVNMGTNALLSSVSITTHSIAAVLQLALSMDYSIILLNRFRQEKSADGSDPVAAMDRAVRNAARTVVSSALTTLVGLMMLCFMNLKIGADMGIVLSKGVVCSLVYALVALPGLALLLNKGIEASEKKVPVMAPGILASFCQKFRYPLAALLLVIFAGSYILHNRTGIHFSTFVETPIDKVFPKQNAVVMLYDNDDESSIIAFTDSILKSSCVTQAISYPSLMKRQMTAPQMEEMLKTLDPEKSELLNEDILKLAYTAAKADVSQIRIAFPELVDFVRSLMSSGKLPEGIVDPSMVEKFKMLDELSAAFAMAEPAVPTESSSTPETTVCDAVLAYAGPRGPMAEESGAQASQQEETMGIGDYMRALYAQEKSENARVLSTLCDVSKLRKKMTTAEMSAYIGSTASQTKMVYSFSKEKTMTPLEYVHFLSDDLFNRKALSAMVSAAQKKDLRFRMKIMDLADAGSVMPLSSLDALAKQFGVQPLKRTAPSGPEETEKINGTTNNTSQVNVPGQTAPADTTSAAAAAGTAAVDASTAQSEIQPESVAPVQEDPRIALLTKMMIPGTRYSAKAMAANFRALGENIDTGTVELLYLCYEMMNGYDPDWTMSLEEFVDFLGVSIMQDPRFQPFIPDSLAGQFDGMRAQMADGVGHLKGKEHSIAAFVTDLPYESPQTESFIKDFRNRADNMLENESYMIGESVMFSEMKDGFSREMLLVTLLTIAAIFLIVALTFKSVITAGILVMTVMSAVFVNVVACGIGGGTMLYLAYLIVQSILMGATIDYGILFAGYYRETGSLAQAYKGSINTILTSGLIMICVPGIMALLLDDAMIAPIVGALAAGSFASVSLILLVMPGVLAAYRKFTVKNK